MSQSQLSTLLARARGRLASLRARDVRLEQPLLEQRRGGRAPGDHRDLRVPVESPGVEVDRAEAGDVVGHDDLGVDDRARELPDLDARSDQVVVAVPQRGACLGVVRRRGHDQPHGHAAAGCREDAFEHVAVGEIRVHHVEAAARTVDLLTDRLGCGHEAAGDHLGERDRRRAVVGRLGKVPSEVVRERPAVAPEARQERRLRLPDDVSGHAHHHVVEAAILEVVLDPRAAGPRDGAVDDVELAVIGAANLVLTPVQLPVVWVQPVAIDREDVVDDDLRPGGREPGEHLLGLAERPRAVAVDDDAHLDAVGQLPLEQRGHRHPDLALPPAEHEDVNRRAGCLDVGEDPGEEGLPLDPRLDGGRG